MKGALRNTPEDESRVHESFYGSHPLGGQRVSLTESKMKNFKACLLIQLYGPKGEVKLKEWHIF